MDYDNCCEECGVDLLPDEITLCKECDEVLLQEEEDGLVEGLSMDFDKWGCY